MAVLATDDFNRANANPIGAPWTAGTGSGTAFQIVSNAVTAVTTTNDGHTYYSGIPWHADQYAQIKITGSATTGGGYGVCCRAATGAHTYYRLVATIGTTNNVYLGKVIAGVFSDVWTGSATRSATIVAGDTLRLEVQGTTLRAYVNGVQVGADVTDTNIASGNPGMAYSFTGAGASADDWEGGGFTAASAWTYGFDVRIGG